MESIGAYLRRERETRGISLEEVADTTRIPVQSLVQLEDGRFGNLPGDVFIKGFLRAYARAVGIRPEEVVARYANEMRARDVQPQRVSLPSVAPDRGRRFGLAIALVVFGIMATLAASFLLRPRTQDRPEQLSNVRSLPSSVSAPV